MSRHFKKRKVLTSDHELPIASPAKGSPTQVDNLILENQKLQKQIVDLKLEVAQGQQLMHEELLKAETQIELIKDLLLREPGM